MLLSISPRFLRPAIVVVATAAALSVATSSAQATCYSSTPTATSFADSPVDGDSGLAPEIGTVALSLDAACNYAVDPGVAGTLIDGDAVFEYVDVDGNPATGSPTFTGADVAIGSLGVTGPDPAPLMGRWDPASSTFSFAGGTTVAPVGAGGFRATLDQLGTTASPTATTVSVASLWTGIYDNYFDFAPDVPQAPIALPIAFSTIAPPPPAPVVTVTPVAQPAPAPPVAPVAPATTPVNGTSVKSCTVPAVQRLRTAVAQGTLRHAGCKVGLTQRVYSSTIAKGRIVTSLPKTGTKRWSEPVDLIVSKGRKPKRKHATAHRASAPDASVAAILEIAARRLDADAR